MRLLLFLLVGFVLGELYFRAIRGGLSWFVDEGTATAVAAMVLRILTAIFVVSLLARFLGGAGVALAVAGFLIARERRKRR